MPALICLLSRCQLSLVFIAADSWSLSWGQGTVSAFSITTVGGKYWFYLCGLGTNKRQKEHHQPLNLQLPVDQWPSPEGHAQQQPLIHWANLWGLYTLYLLFQPMMSYLLVDTDFRFSLRFDLLILSSSYLEIRFQTMTDCKSC